MNLKDYTIEELEEAIEKKKRASLPKARLMTDIVNDITKLIERYAEEHKEMLETGYPPKDNDHYKFEDMMELIYGKDYWSWYNEVVI